MIVIYVNLIVLAPSTQAEDGVHKLGRQLAHNGPLALGRSTSP